MLFYLNMNVFNNPKDNVTNQDVIDTLNDLVKLIKLLSKYQSDIIFSSDFLTTSICGKAILEYINTLEEDSKKILFRRVDISSNIHCSDLYEEYLQDDLEIDFSSCIEKISSKDIFGTFLACALFNDVPIITSDKLTNDTVDNIEILNDGTTYEIVNYSLSDSSRIIDKFKENDYEIINSWEEYISYSKQEFIYIDFTKNCIKDLKKLATTLSDKYIRLIREQIEGLNQFVLNNGGDPKSCDNLEVSGVNATPETSSRLGYLSDKLTKKNCNNNKEVMNWHAKIDFYRLYFTCNLDNKMCFTFFTKKIPNQGS